MVAFLALVVGACVAVPTSSETEPTEVDASGTSLIDGIGRAPADDRTSTTSGTTTGTAGAPTTQTESTPSTAPAPTEPVSTEDAPSAADVRLQYELVVEGIDQPIMMTPIPGADTVLLATKAGIIRQLTDDGLGAVVVDLSSSIQNSGERGLLGLAVHPAHPNRMFVHYSAAADGATTISEFGLDDLGIAHPESEQVLLTVDQPASNHNGGMIQFGPDGALYVGLGDGGGGGDQFGQAQDGSTLLGSLVRLDVDTGEATVHATGLRNPWRFWIDGDEIYVADVGQNAYEEVSVTSLEPGLNYGWPITEGLHCFQPATGCDVDGTIVPVIEVEHGDGGSCSITGGVVYRGEAIPALDGHYFYSDFCGGYLRSFRNEEGSTVDVRDWTVDVGVPGQVLSFGVDGSGEMYVLTQDTVLRVISTN